MEQYHTKHEEISEHKVSAKHPETKPHKRDKKRLGSEGIILLLLLFALIACCGTAVAVYRMQEDPLCERIEEDPCFQEGVFYINNKKDYLRFSGYVNRAWKESETDERDGAVAIDAVLTADLDLEEETGYRLNDHPYIKRPILRYNGTFDGNGHTIRWNVDAGYGMFACLLRGAEIRNLTVQADHIAFLPADGDGGLADSGYGIGILCMANYGSITGCQVQGRVEGEKSYIGGIAGINYGTIKDCVNRASVDAMGVGEYGAGGITGKNEDTWTESDQDEEIKAAIYGCTNLGTVTGDWLAGGICSVNSGGNTEIRQCGNEGEISVRYQSVQPYLENAYDENLSDRWEEAMAGGIAGKMDSGLFSECYNTGRISIQEEGNGGTYGIAGSAFGNSEVLNCVSLEGMATGHMRHENIMELSAAEMERWQADPASFPYVHNNWQFDLEEAKDKLGIVPLGITRSFPENGKEHVYLCDAFVLRAPQGFIIREVSEYALCVEAREGAALSSCYGEDAAGWQVWILRLPDEEVGNMNRFLQKTEKLESIYAGAGAFDSADSSLPGAFWLSSLDDEETESDISRIWGCMEEPNWLRPLYFINWWDHHTWKTEGRYSLNLYKEELNAKHYVFVDKEDRESLRMDNIISLPVKSSVETGNEVPFLLLFTDRNSNYRPDTEFAREVLAGFSYLPFVHRTEPGDTLWDLAKSYTGEGARYPELAVYNGLEEADRILEGQYLQVPEMWLAE